ncbi:porin [Sinomicrobium pectinilyticum]|uniref:Porin n=1 Tax=Sinomicrobium pectinilyticum TaxID=1084421 RepID=A0A3N0E4S4_SINP1|nr:porin [Sinomicrobium pectinilyticum]RNL82803.1 porin [Sinomicrobium pectinilyticum]
MKSITMTKFVKKVLFAIMAFVNLTVFAQEEAKFQISGSVDGYYRYNFSDEQRQAPLSSFANDPGFALGMANVIASYEGEKVGFVADLVFGPRGEDAVFLSTGSSNIVNQLYVYWTVSDAVTLTFGNFNTFLGYEVISPTGNFNYSTSYMFSYGPFSHTGLKADFSLSENWSAMLAVMNPTDYTEYNPAGVYTFGAQLGYETEKGGTWLNAIYGKQYDGTAISEEATFQIDLTTGYDLTDMFYLGLNATYNETKDAGGFYGVALYPQVKTSESFALGLRAEYFKELEDGGPVYGPDINTWDFTLTGSYTVGDLTIKPELRLDTVSEDRFFDKDSYKTGIPTEGSLGSFVLAAIYKF